MDRHGDAERKDKDARAVVELAMRPPSPNDMQTFKLSKEIIDQADFISIFKIVDWISL